MYKFTLLPLLFLSFILSCDKDSDSNDSTPPQTEANEKLQTVISEFLPTTLLYKSLDDEIKLLEGDPCEDIPGSDKMEIFLNCQPTLLKIYLTLSKLYISEISAILEEDKALIDKALQEDGTFKLEEDGAAFVSGKIEDKSLSFTLAAAEFEDDDATQVTNGNFQLDITFSDNDNWELVAYMAEIPCHPESLDDPERFKLVVSKEGEIRKGKMMTYHAQSGQSCDEAVTEDSSMNIYSDFVATEGEVKGEIFMLSRGVSDLADIDKYEIGAVCKNFAKYCNEGSKDYTDTISNPLCLTDEKPNGVWGSDCVNDLTTIKDEDFSPANQWVIPSDFYQLDAPNPN